MNNLNRIYFILLAFLLVQPTLAFSQNQAQASTIRVFAVNQSDQAIDVEFGKNPTVFAASTLGAFSVSKMHLVAKPGSYQFFFKPSGARDFVSPRNEGGQPYLYQVEAGKNYALRILDKTSAEVVELEEPAGSQAKITFINASALPLSQVQVASEFNKNILVYLRSLASKSITTFATVNYPASYAIYWAKPDAASNASAFQSIFDASGKAMFNLYENGSFWAFLAFQDKNNAVSGRLFKLLP